MNNAADNGGFPRPPEGVETAVVECHHSACAGVTRVVVPRILAPSALRRVVCANCGREFQPAEGSVQPLVGTAAARPGTTDLPPEFFIHAATGDDSGRKRSRSRLALVLLIPLLAIATIGGLALIRALENTTPDDGATTGSTQAPPAENTNPEAQQIVGQGYTFVLPAGWATQEPPDGARYSAVSGDGMAEVTLWVDTESDLEFPEFIEVSLAELRQEEGSAEIVKRTPAATPEESVVRIATNEIEGRPHQVVTLRFNGPYRYYFTTTTQPDASPELIAEVDAMHESFTPISVSGNGSGDEDASGGGNGGGGNNGSSNGNAQGGNG